MVISTIQISEDAKKALNRIKGKRETYEEVILNLIRIVETSKREKEKLLIEGCKEMAKENLRITNEFEAIEDLDTWEW